MERITGTLIWYSAVCARQVWLMAHELNPDEDHELLELGRFLSDQSYPRQKLRQISLPGMAIDWIEGEEEQEELLVAEVKSSSRSLPAARLQVLFYLHQLETYDLKARGEIRIPKERKRVEVVLDESGRQELAEVMDRVHSIIRMPLPPRAEWIPQCRSCAYAEFCWAGDGGIPCNETCI